jgi:hypothetical protein
MSSSDEEDIGQEIERTLPSKVSKRRWTKRLPIARRQEAIELKLLGKEDPEFHVIEREKKGSYIVRKRAHPLKPIQEPTVIQSISSPPTPTVAPPTPTVVAIPSPLVPDTQNAKVDIPVLSYFNNQNSVNTSLSSELKELREMFGRLEEKYVKVKKTLKKSNTASSKSKKVDRADNVQQDYEPTDEEVRAYEEYLKAEALKELQDTQSPRIVMRRRPIIDINRF